MCDSMCNCLTAKKKSAVGSSTMHQTQFLQNTLDKMTHKIIIMRDFLANLVVKPIKESYPIKLLKRNHLLGGDIALLLIFVVEHADSFDTTAVYQ